MDGEIRRREIVKRLRETEKPISATRFAKAFDVSRQIIVGDVALLRATGVEIVATARGYMLEQPLEGIERKIACQHTPEQTREELSVIVAKGGEVVDVSIAHPLYGELIGSLRIQSEKDIDKFMDKYQKEHATLLSVLTGGVHLHTIRCADEETFREIKEALRKKSILFEG
ncbi:transcription repressor NadR [Enterococcus faecalis]|uniref:transcription repressor NadR n=1 Tax=Enterococcus faecalis TaxID=1351 RepID=UPI001D0B69FA|nr:transcription repressor NadR [Enterococcus faecalis]MCB8544225.1 transcription repressor NadR [Enterococcus faecalis]